MASDWKEDAALYGLVGEITADGTSSESVLAGRQAWFVEFVSASSEAPDNVLRVVVDPVEPDRGYQSYTGDSFGVQSPTPIEGWRKNSDQLAESAGCVSAVDYNFELSSAHVMRERFNVSGFEEVVPEDLPDSHPVAGIYADPAYQLLDGVSGDVLYTGTY